MTDNELLLAISDIMDKKLDARIKPLENRIIRLDERITNLEGRMTNLEECMTSLEHRMTVLENDVQTLKLQNENILLPRLEHIESCYTSTFERYKDNVEGYESMQSDVQLLKEVSREHSQKLQMIS